MSTPAPASDELLAVLTALLELVALRRRTAHARARWELCGRRYAMSSSSRARWEAATSSAAEGRPYAVVGCPLGPGRHYHALPVDELELELLAELARAGPVEGPVVAPRGDRLVEVDRHTGAVIGRRWPGPDRSPAMRAPRRKGARVPP